MDYYGYGMYNSMIYSYETIVYAATAVLAILIATVLFFTMLRKENEKKFTGFKARIYHFLNVNKFYAEDIIRFLYVVTVCVLTLLGLAQIVMGSFLSGLLIAVAGNIAARVSYECMLMFFVLVRKTVTIDKRLSKIEKFYGDDFDGGSSCEQSDMFCGEEDEEYEEADKEADASYDAYDGCSSCDSCSPCDSCSTCEQCVAADCGAANAYIDKNNELGYTYDGCSATYTEADKSEE